MNGPAPALADTQLAQVFRDAGFMGENLITMIAVSLAESGGDPDNVGDEALVNKTWGPSIGLAQIRSLWAQRGTGRSRDADRLTDPAFNARAAYEISSGGTNFRPWSMWTNQRYLGFVARARAAAAQLAGGKGTPVRQGLEGSQGITGGLPGGSLVDAFVTPLVEGAGRIALVGVLLAGGVALVAAGAWRGSGLAAKKKDLESELAPVAMAVAL